MNIIHYPNKMDRLPTGKDLEKFVDELPRESQERLLGILEGKKLHNGTIGTHENNELQSNLCIIVDKTSPMLGDATITEICHFKPETVSIEDAVNFIVREKSVDEWGEIIVRNPEQEIIATFSYEKGIITDQNSKLPKDTKVRLKRSNGGWGSMDYDLVVVE